MAAKPPLYVLRMEYREIGVGTITQVQNAQKAIEALQLVEPRYVRDADDHKRFLVLCDDEDATSVSRCNEKVLTPEEFERENVKKICGPAAPATVNGKAR
jgi:hypothetical protein